MNDPADAAQKLRLLWVSGGDRDGLMRIRKNFHDVLGEKKVPHIWHIDSGGHDFAVWKMNLYNVSQRLSR